MTASLVEDDGHRGEPGFVDGGVSGGTDMTKKDRING